MLPGSFVGTLSEPPDQLLKDQSHLVVGDCLGGEIGCPHLLHYFIQQIVVIEPANELTEIEIFKDLPGTLGEPIDIRFQVVFDTGFTQLAQVHL